MTWNKPLTPEGCVKRDIRQYLRWKGWKVIHIQAGPLSERGLTDMIAVKNGIVLWIEGKVPPGMPTRTGGLTKGTNLSKDQIKFRDDLVAHGGLHFVLRSLEDTVQMVMDIESGKLRQEAEY